MNHPAVMFITLLFFLLEWMSSIKGNMPEFSRIAGGGLISSFDYSQPTGGYASGYDKDGNLLKILEDHTHSGVLDRAVTNTYDRVYRLKVEDINHFNATTGNPIIGPPNNESVYAYDKANNRTSCIGNPPPNQAQLSIISHSYPGPGGGYNSNQLATTTRQQSGSGNPVTTFTYDANGNRKTAVTGTKTDTYTWDPENRLTGLSFNSGAEGTTGSYNYGYDYRSRRVVRDEGTTTGVKIAASFSGGSSVQEYQFREIHDRYQDADFDGTANLLEYAFGRDPLSGNGNATYSPPYPVSGFAEWAAAAILNRLTVAEIIAYRDARTTLKTQIIRGSDWGGGIGGILYTIRDGARSYNAYNSRGDVVSTTDASGAATWQASYEAFGQRTAEQGDNAERQRANTKDEDPTGLLNEGFRYRDLETGVFISRDPAGFVDGPNVYTYVRQNPWTFFDPLGLELMPNYNPNNASLWDHIKFAGATIIRAPQLMAEKVIQKTEDIPVVNKVAGPATDFNPFVAASQTTEKVLDEGVSTAVIVGIVVEKTLGKVPGMKGKGDEIADALTDSARQTEKKTKAIVAGETRDYGDFRKFSGDGLEGHELLQNSKLQQMGADSSTKAANPAIALTQEQHKEVTKLQRKAGLHNPAKLAEQSPSQNVRSNVRITKEAGVVSRSQLAETARKAREHAKKVEGNQ